MIKSRVVLSGVLLAVVSAAPVFAQDDKKEAAGGTVELKLELPKPMFVGTPRNLSSDNLEAPTSGPREAVKVPAGTTLISKGKTVTASDTEPVVGTLDLATDGNKEGTDGNYVELGPGKQWVQIDLGKKSEISAIVLWHFHSQARVYKDVVIQIADDADFIEKVRTVFNNDHDNSAGLGIGKDKEWIETNSGRVIPVKEEKAQYIRLYSNGNTSNPMNQYLEVEVYGKQ